MLYTTIVNDVYVPNAIANKSNIGHLHVIADVTGLETALSGKAASSHTHTIANILLRRIRSGLKS